MNILPQESMWSSSILCLVVHHHEHSATRIYVVFFYFVFDITCSLETKTCLDYKSTVDSSSLLLVKQNLAVNSKSSDQISGQHRVGSLGETGHPEFGCEFHIFWPNLFLWAA
jgi:hypothetical protein